MLFNSINFAVFLPVVFLLYWFVFKKLSHQNLLLLVASYFFYACWDWRFVFLLLFSTTLDYFSGLIISGTRSELKRKSWFWASIVVNLGFLGVFKYFNFFIESFAEGLSLLGLQYSPWTLSVILPVGISFYTFHGLSYVIDVYYRRIEPEKRFVDYAVFVSFFPLLVAGPIERARHLLPQIKKERFFEYDKGVDGLRQILWGLFKKIVIADQCAVYVNYIFDNSETCSGSTLVLGAVFFAFQIYGDFSGYSDIALGTARLFGIELLKNFSFPYFSRDIAEFWRRWHISLSSWFRDYLYIPLGGSRGGKWLSVRNTFIIFTISGFWHGANWTFVVWGVLHALFFIPLLLSGRNRKYLDVVAKGRLLPTLSELGSVLMTFTLTSFAWIFFRAENLTHAVRYIGNIFTPSLFELPNDFPVYIFLLLGVFIFVEWCGREDAYAIEERIKRFGKPVRYFFYYLLLVGIFIFHGEKQEFIYFQF